MSVRVYAMMAKWRVRKRAFCTLLFSIICVLQVQRQQVTLAYETAPNAGGGYETYAASAVGRAAHEPKFGERLLPLRKNTKTNTISHGASAVKVQQQQQGTTERVASVNNLLNKSNYIVSQAENASAKKVHKPPMLPVAAAVDTNEDTLLYTVAVSTLEEATDKPTTPFSSNTRQAKLLHRQEDTNVVGGEVLLPTTAAHTNISQAARLEMSTEFFIVPSSSSTVATSVHQNGSSGNVSHLGTKTRGLLTPQSAPPRSVLIVAPPKSGGTHANNNATSPTIVPLNGNSASAFAGGLRKEPWVVPVLVLASLTMLMMGAFEIFVLFKAWRTSPSRRHLFLGQMLLLGLFACAGLGAIITAQPSLLSCGTIRFGVGVAYALVFAALLVKCVFLISLNGGVYLPAPYQGLLLLFAVLIQVAIGAQWLLTQPPEIYTLQVPILGSGLLASTVASSTAPFGSGASTSTAASQFAAAFFHSTASSSHPSVAASDLYTRISAASSVLIPLCKTQFSELLFSLIYIVFLIVFVAVLAIKSRGIRDNYREATYIGLAIGGAIPIWLGWMFVGLAVAERHKDACIAFGLVATSATVFLVMFMPKGRQLAAMGKEGLYVEDREEQFSSLSRAGSGYSPSFFHFKPIKYGVMSGGMQNSTSNTGNGASMKHCSNGMGGGDRVALVAAAPPSYTRMYHYFPAHLTAHPFCFYPQPPPPPPPLTQLPSPPTLKQLGNSLTSMTQAHIAQTLRYPGLFIRPDETNLYTTLEPTLSSNPNVYFQRGGAVHPGMMY